MSNVVWEARIEKAERYIDESIDLRRQLGAGVTELRSRASLFDLQSALGSDIDRLIRVPPKGGAFPVSDDCAIDRAFENEKLNLKKRIEREIRILESEFALNLGDKSTHAGVSVHTGGGPAIVNLGEIRGSVQQVVGTLNETGHADIAAILERLTAAIADSEQLGADRQTYLEQVQFIAKQAIEPAATRQTSTVQAVFESLRARLQDVANIAQILAVAAPQLAHHFGIKLLG